MTENARPLRGAMKKPTTAPAASDAAAPLRDPLKPPQASTRLAPVAAPTAMPATPPPGPIDQRLVRRIGRGRTSVEAVLDLHGLTQERAHAGLLTFLLDSQRLGRRLVLVVTGKGRADETGAWWEAGQRGILRRVVPEWLETAEFRPLVAGYRQAHARKGGPGAFYVQLRRRRAGAPGS